jgi:alkanesulfonate monooxygenase SsuD/methylene tetrahydromethanopterin reductase-like flavin-dependent oxidoreductase (luciferase family)
MEKGASMQIGIGLPNPVPGTEGHTLIEWARKAEERGFSGLATIDRIAYPSYESIVALAAAAAVTERIGLSTNVLLGPTRNPVLLAKEAASLDQLSSGRFTLGLAVGSREDDYLAVGRDFNTRGARWDRDLELIHRAWAGELVSGAKKPVGPTPVNGRSVPILIGGMSEKAVERTIRWGDGWTVGGAPPHVGGPFAERVRGAWKEAGKQGEPKIVGLTYFSLAEDGLERATHYLGDYYGDFGKQFAEAIPKKPDDLRGYVKQFEEFGFDELFLDPVTSDLGEIDRAADAVL